MTNIKLALVAATAFALLVPAVTSANAQPGDVQFVRHGFVYAPGIDRRIVRQRKRIRHARREGSLTWWEAQKLRSRLAGIRRELRYASLDGGSPVMSVGTCTKCLIATAAGLPVTAITNV